MDNTNEIELFEKCNDLIIDTVQLEHSQNISYAASDIKEDYLFDLDYVGSDKVESIYHNIFPALLRARIEGYCEYENEQSNISLVEEEGLWNRNSIEEFTTILDSERENYMTNTWEVLSE